MSMEYNGLTKGHNILSAEYDGLSTEYKIIPPYKTVEAFNNFH